MDVSMTRNNFSNSNPEWLRAIEGMVSETVLFFRNRGHNRDVAIEQAALALGMTRRKARSIFYQEPVGVAREERDRVFQAFMCHLDDQADDYTRRAEAVRAKRRQMEIGL